MKLDFLPLKTNAYIHEGNALKTGGMKLSQFERSTLSWEIRHL